MAPPDVGENGTTPEPPRNPRRLRVVESAEAEPAPRTSERPVRNLPLRPSSFVGCIGGLSGRLGWTVSQRAKEVG